MKANPLINQIEFRVRIKKGTSNVYYRRGMGKDLIEAYEYFLKTQTGLNKEIEEEVTSLFVALSEWLKTGHRTRLATRKAAKDVTREVIKDGRLLGYRRNGRMLDEAETRAYLKSEE